jgi:L-2-hydroxyglutarate oxidase LhgO
VFKDYYHEVGRVTGAHGGEESWRRLRGVYERGQSEGWGEGMEWLDGGEQIREKLPQLEGADLTVGCTCSVALNWRNAPDRASMSSHRLQGWKGLWSPDSGWVAAKESIASVGRELQRLSKRWQRLPLY